MSPQSSTSASTLDLLMRRVASVCDKHRVPSGIPLDLADFVKELGRNKLLAMDFWAVIGGAYSADMTESEEDAPGQDDWSTLSAEELQAHILDAVVQVLTGSGVAAMASAGGASRRAVEDMKGLLAGEDVHFEASEIDRTTAEDDVKSRKLTGSGPQEQKPLKLLSLPARTVEASPRSGSNFASDSDSNVRPISEPKSNVPGWSDLLSTDWAAADRKAAESRQRMATASQEASTQAGDRDLRRILFQEPRQRSSETGSSRSIPTQTIDLPVPKTDFKRLAIIAGSVVLILLCGGVAIRLHQAGQFHRFGASVHKMLSSFGTSEQAPATVASTNESTKPAKARGVSAGHRQAAEPGAAKANEAANTAKAGGDSEATADTKSGTPENAAMVSSKGTATTEKAVEAAPVEVVAEVMKANLITSPNPDSLVGVKAAQGDARVVMQALISKTGVVESLRVLEGPPALRAAATQEVLTWRYRPYVVNGVPVAVTTRITASFKIDP